MATFIYADGMSYLTNNPAACVNCHSMNPQYEAWQASSHRSVAVCNDCHAHGNFLEKYSQKAVNGFLHSFAFTTGWHPEPIRIKNFNLEIAKRACLTCHGPLVETSRFDHLSFGDKDCLKCHREVGHRKW